jgi:hypothetical protein
MAVTSTNMVASYVCKIVVDSNASNKWQYSTDGGTVWNTLTVGLELTITTNGTTNYHLRLNAVDEGIYILKLSSKYDVLQSNTSKYTYIINETGGAVIQSMIDANIQDGAITLINEEIHNDL